MANIFTNLDNYPKLRVVISKLKEIKVLPDLTELGSLDHIHTCSEGELILLLLQEAEEGINYVISETSAGPDSVVMKVSDDFYKAIVELIKPAEPKKATDPRIHHDDRWRNCNK